MILILAVLVAVVIKVAPNMKQQIYQRVQTSVTKDKKIQKLENEVAKLKREKERAKKAAMEKEMAMLKKERDEARERLAQSELAAELAKKEALNLAAKKPAPAKASRPKPIRSTYVQPRYVNPVPVPAPIPQPVVKAAAPIAPKPIAATEAKMPRAVPKVEAGSAEPKASTVQAKKKKKAKPAKKVEEESFDEDDDFFADEDE